MGLSLTCSVSCRSELALIPSLSPEFVGCCLWRCLPRGDAQPLRHLIQPNKPWRTDFLWSCWLLWSIHSLPRAVIIPLTPTEVAAPSLRFAARALFSALGFPYRLSAASHFSFIITTFHFPKFYMVFLFFTVVFTSLTSSVVYFFNQRCFLSQLWDCGFGATRKMFFNNSHLTVTFFWLNSFSQLIWFIIVSISVKLNRLSIKWIYFQNRASL